ncbi:PBP1A family penicillin-binding protein [Paracoccus sp. S-4012]|uniref:transglycosylase domain-containing protein n=1 Tax=Paracoccus sp. S-4012 TaxID=2665648 RepID=UPI0012B0855D|nr:transglycosylase domain-containing protein [Paracoccus sp. S-4012]MRX49113.1 PBP1A family penicillin-binding protein [Paracoccus sp. S-4012]
MKKPSGSPRRLTADRRIVTEPPPESPRKPRRRAKARPARRGNWLVRSVTGGISLVWRVLWGSFWRLGLVMLLILSTATAFYYADLPEAAELFDGRARGSVTMMDTDGRTFAWRGETFGMVTSDKIAPVLREAVIATEDRRFYIHPGIDPRGIASAIRINLSEGRGPLEGHGGSTITQQVSKLLCLGEEFDPTRWESESAFEAECRTSSLWRKVKEVPFSLALEIKYSKDDILNIYMNRSYLGGGARGFEAASQRYFDKPALEVSLPEAAMLAGLLQAPSYYAPTGNIQRSQNRANVVLALMREQGYINEPELEAARANPAQLSRAAAARSGGYFADWLMESGPGFLTSETTEDVVIRTTFDQRVQRAAERAMNQIFAEKVKEGSAAQAAVVVMSADGAVRAMIGGRTNTEDGTFNRATQARRQPGSAFKPFVFAAALDQGYSPDSIVLDGPLTINIPGSGPWSPQNYTRRYLGEITLTRALSQSINTATIRLQEAAGRENVRRVAEDFGFGGDMTHSPSLGLGASESTLLEMTGAYAGIRNGGTAVRPYGMVEVRLKSDDTPLIGQSGGMGRRVISQKAAGELIGMMRQVIEGGTGGRAKLPGRDAAGKTGTTSSYRDAWFIGFTDQYVTGVWMGYDDNTPLTGVTGGGLPAEMWQAVMAEIHEGLPNVALGTDFPEGVGATQITPVAMEGGDPLAAALGQVLGAPAGDPMQAALGEAMGAPATPGRIVSNGPEGQASPVAPQGGADPLAAALGQAMGSN